MEATATSRPDAKPEAERQDTAYKILQLDTDSGWWPVETPGSDDGNVRAPSAKKAIELHLEAIDDGDSDPTGRLYVAVPARSWRPLKIGGVEDVPAKRQFKLD